MDEMAAMLSDYAGGLQQSFASVFERVGESLSQSAQVMRMMNGVMEAALLQSLQAECALAASDAAPALRVRVANASQIHVAALAVSVRLDGSDVDIYSSELEALAPGDERELLVPLQDPSASMLGTLRLALQSPGTQQPLTKSVPFRVFFFEGSVFEPVARDAVDLAALAVVESADVTLEALRRALRLSPLDAMMTTEHGCYRLAATPRAARQGTFYVLLRRDATVSPPFRVGVAVNASPGDDSLTAQCALMLRDLEALSRQMD